MSMDWPVRRWHRSTLAIVLVGLVGCANDDARAWSGASDWSVAHGARVRLVAADVAPPGGEQRLVAGVHVVLDDGWKTYWRSPGDSGGIPPTIDWEESTNLGKAYLSYPMPHRFKDSAGESIGYKGEVVFLLNLEPEARDTPIDLKLGVFLGVCKEICVPISAELALTTGTGTDGDPAIAELVARFAKSVPRAAATDALDDFAIVNAGGRLTGSKPELLLDVRFPDGATSRDLFIETDDGTYVPLPGAVGDAGGRDVRARVDLTKTTTPGDIAGRTLIVTIVSDQGAVELRRKLR